MSSLSSVTVSKQTRAVQYVRMSTEHQKYSLQNQMETIAHYAAKHDIDVVRTYQDTARSGLSLAGRPALSNLLEETLAGSADFQVILVYDVSRWGRFQDADESAHYEFLCNSMGISIRYCAEPFEYAGISTSIYKALKRAMAAEYSRELSLKTFAGHCSLVRQGFHAGGAAPFGFRRLLLAEDGTPKGVLSAGERKNIKSERVILTPGPAFEIQTVQRIFDLYLSRQHSTIDIADILNSERPHGGTVTHWSRIRVRNVLKNENHIGNLVYSRRSARLGSKSQPNPSDKWVRNDQAIKPTIDEKRFLAAQRLLTEGVRNKTDEEILGALRNLYSQAGRLTTDKIHNTPRFPRTIVFQHRFGGLRKAYAMIGHPLPTWGHLRDLPNVSRAFGQLQEEVSAIIGEAGGQVTRARHRGLLVINAAFNIRIAVVAAQRDQHGSVSWRVRTRTPFPHDALIAARMDSENSSVIDYYFFPNLGDIRKIVSLGNPKSERHTEFAATSLNPLRLACARMQTNGFPKSVDEFRALVKAARNIA